MNFRTAIGYAAVFLLAAASPHAAAASWSAGRQKADSTRFSHHVSADIRPKYIIPTNKFFRGENALGKRLGMGGSAHLQYSFSFPESSRPGKLFPTAYQGVGVAFNTFLDHREIGSPAALYVFQGARLAQLSRKLTLDYEWNFGASFGWHPYGDSSGSPNEYNMVVGSKVNAYINLGLLLSWRPLDSWTFSAGLDLTHFSNGNTSLPNAGVNTAGVRMSAKRSFGPAGHRTGPADEVSRSHERESRKRSDRMTCDVLLYGAWRAKAVMWNDSQYLAKGRFGIAGVNISPLYRVCRFFRAGASLDVQYDESANVGGHVAGIGDDGDIRFYRPPLDEQFGIGLSLRAEFVMPVFSVNIGIGHSVFGKGEDLKGFYQTLSLKTELYKGLYLNIGYRLHDFHDPNNLMLGLGWRFGRQIP